MFRKSFWIHPNCLTKPTNNYFKLTWSEFNPTKRYWNTIVSWLTAISPKNQLSPSKGTIKNEARTVILRRKTNVTWCKLVVTLLYVFCLGFVEDCIVRVKKSVRLPFCHFLYLEFCLLRKIAYTNRIFFQSLCFENSLVLVNLCRTNASTIMFTCEEIRELQFHFSVNSKSSSYNCANLLWDQRDKSRVNLIWIPKGLSKGTNRTQAGHCAEVCFDRCNTLKRGG